MISGGEQKLINSIEFALIFEMKFGDDPKMPSGLIVN